MGLRHVAVVCAALALSAGCTCGTPMVVGEPPSDGGIDAGPADASPLPDAQPDPVDAFVADAHAPDAFAPDAPPFDCASCAPAAPCEVLVCEGACAYTPLADGEACGTAGVCLAAACISRGCGDGVREPGPKPAREACDDGNAIDSDLCASCVPQHLAVASAAGRDDTTYGPHGVEVDGQGRALALYTTRASGGGATLYGQRFDAFGAPEGTPLDLGAGATAPGSAVVGLASGWAVVTSSTSTTIRIVSATGSIGAPRIASMGSFGALRDTALAALSTGELLAGWSDITTPTANRVYLRWLDASATPIEAPMLAVPTAAVAPAIARSGADVLLVTWIDLAAAPRLVGRRMARTGWIDPAPFELYPGLGSAVALAPSDDGWWVAFVAREQDSEGDIYVHAVAHTGAPVTGTATRITGRDPDGSTRGELQPSIASAGTGWICAWEVRSPSQVELMIGGTGAVGAELADLSPLLVGSSQRGVSVARSDRGTWVLWADTRLGDPDAQRSAIAFLLPPP